MSSELTLREFMGRVGPLVALLGETCAQCGLEYRTNTDIEEHGAIGGLPKGKRLETDPGFMVDVVGTDGWADYWREKGVGDDPRYVS